MSLPCDNTEPSGACLWSSRLFYSSSGAAATALTPTTAVGFSSAAFRNRIVSPGSSSMPGGMAALPSGECQVAGALNSPDMQFSACYESILMPLQQLPALQRLESAIGPYDTRGNP
jgi:hypothetical protein